MKPGLALLVVCGVVQPLGTLIATAPPFMFPPLDPAVNANVKLLPLLPAIAVVAVTAMDPSPSCSAAIVYGPNNGPPPGTPIGVAETVLASATTRCMFTRPLPVSDAVPAGSAFCANRPTMTELLAAGSTARSKAMTPATIAEDADVPVIVM